MALFNFCGIACRKRMPRDQLVNFYLEIIKRLREKVEEGRPKIPKNGSWIFYRNNDLAYYSFLCF